jgi:hypothetical protein
MRPAKVIAKALSAASGAWPIWRGRLRWVLAANVTLPGGYDSGVILARDEAGLRRIAVLVDDAAAGERILKIDTERRAVSVIIGVSRIDRVTGTDSSSWRRRPVGIRGIGGKPRCKGYAALPRSWSSSTNRRTNLARRCCTRPTAAHG